MTTELDKPYLNQLRIEVKLLDDIIYNLEHKEHFFAKPEKVVDLDYIKKVHELRKKLIEGIDKK